MKIRCLYTSRKTGQSLSNLTCGKDVVNLEDKIAEIKSPSQIVNVLRALCINRVIYAQPLDCTKIDKNVYRVKLEDGFGNVSYLELIDDNEKNTLTNKKPKISKEELKDYDVPVEVSVTEAIIYDWVVEHYGKSEAVSSSWNITALAQHLDEMLNKDSYKQVNTVMYKD
jgi:hypothetical protein